MEKVPTKEIERKKLVEEKSLRLTKETLKSLRTVCLSVVGIEALVADVVVVTVVDWSSREIGSRKS